MSDKKNKHARAKRGLCVECKEKREQDNKWYCKKHAKAHSLTSQVSAQKRLKDGKCVHCSKDRDPKSKRYCTEHLADAKDRNQAHREKRRKQDRCIRCTRPLATKFLCRVHADEQAAYQREYKRKVKDGSIVPRVRDVRPSGSDVVPTGEGATAPKSQG